LPEQLANGRAGDFVGDIKCVKVNHFAS